MRIQETDRILKESRIARHTNVSSEHETGVMERAWKTISALPQRVAGMFRHH